MALQWRWWCSTMRIANFFLFWLLFAIEMTLNCNRLLSPNYRLPVQKLNIFLHFTQAALLAFRSVLHITLAGSSAFLESSYVADEWRQGSQREYNYTYAPRELVREFLISQSWERLWTCLTSNYSFVNIFFVNNTFGLHTISLCSPTSMCIPLL